MASKDEEIVSEINRRISIKNDRIADIAKETSRKEVAAENEINNRYELKVIEIKSNLSSEIAKMHEASQKVAEWTSRKKDLNNNIKNLENELKKIKLPIMLIGIAAAIMRVEEKLLKKIRSTKMASVPPIRIIVCTNSIAPLI